MGVEMVRSYVAIRLPSGRFRNFLRTNIIHLYLYTNALFISFKIIVSNIYTKNNEKRGKKRIK